MPHFHLPIMFNFTFHVCAIVFHMVNTDVPAGVGAPPLNTQLQVTLIKSHLLEKAFTVKPLLSGQLGTWGCP